MVEFFYLLPEISLLLLTLIVLFSNNKILLSFIAVIIVSFIAAYSIFYYGNQYFLNTSLIFISNFTQSSKLVVLLFSLFIFLQFLAIPEKYDIDLPILMLFSTLGMLLTISANNFLTLYVALEMQSLPSYVLASSNKHNTLSAEAGVKYFVLGALASGIMLYGITLIYGFTGGLNFIVIGDFIRAMGLSLGLFVGILFVLVGIGFKIAAAPFHFWAPDVYHGAPSIVTTFFLVLPRISIIAVLSRILYVPFYNSSISLILFVLAILSVGIGAFGGLLQNNLKRLLAYSSITHVGYILMFLGSGLALSTNLEKSNLSYISFFYITLYSLLNLGLGSLLLIMKEGNLQEIAGLAQRRPYMALCTSILLFSMAGLPPFAGFFAKVTLLYEIIKNGFIGLAVIALIATVIAAYYYLRIIKVMYFDESSQEAVNIPSLLTYVIILTTITSILITPIYLFI